MTIIPANETAYRLKVRRRLTLDLFTRYGTFWEQIDAMRDQWRVDVIVAVPPEPSFHAEAVGLLDRYTMPERFHMPQGNEPTTAALAETIAEAEADDDAEAAEAIRIFSEELAKLEARIGSRNRAAMFLKELQGLWKEHIAPDRPGERGGDWRNGANVNGWLTWTAFLSACVLYDPPPDRLLEFADHDDYNAAALRQRTFSQDGEQMVRAGMVKARILGGELQAMDEYRDSLRESYIESMQAPEPARSAGKQKLDDLESVQAALWKRQGLSHLQSAERGGWLSHSENTDPRERKNKNITRVKRGESILESRKYSG